MLSTTTYPSPPPAGRFLRPDAVLRRGRLVRLGVAAAVLRDAQRRAQALALVARLFPAKLDDFGPYDGWLGVLHRLLDLCEGAGWFEPDWRYIEDMQDWEMQTSGDDNGDDPDLEHEAGYYLSLFLTGVPVRYYNYGEDAWLESVPDNEPLLAAVRARVDRGYGEHADYGDGVAYGDEAVEQIANSEQWAAMAAPFDGLPDLIRYCRQETGNELLDYGYDGWDIDPERLTWADDLDTVRRLHAAAAPTWQRIEALLEWARGDQRWGAEPGRVIYVLELIDDVAATEFGDDDDDND